MTSRRNTIQKDLVRNAVYEMKRHVTANEVYEFIKESYPTIGKGTVYRNLDILVEEGALRKVEVPDGPNRFDFTSGLFIAFSIRLRRLFALSMK